MSMRRLRALAVLVLAVIAAPGIASLAGAAKGAGGGGGGVVPPVVNTTNFKSTMSSVTGLPACTGAETNTTATPAVCQTAAPILVDPVLGLAIPTTTVAGTKLRVHVAALDPAKFPLTGCAVAYRIGSVVGSTPLVGPVAPEIGNLADFRAVAPAGTIKSGDTTSFDLVCNFQTGAILGRRGVVVTPGRPMHTETHWSGILI